jgi:ADP-heptose:LPS heptosyltransferase
MKYEAIDLAGKTNLGLLGNVVKHCRLLISNDTGVSHLADALNTPSVVIYQVSDSRRWAPIDHQLHRIIGKDQAENIDRVIAEAHELLANDLKSLAVA